jgi:hypothetical protein
MFFSQVIVVVFFCHFDIIAFFGLIQIKPNYVVGQDHNSGYWIFFPFFKTRLRYLNILQKKNIDP